MSDTERSGSYIEPTFEFLIASLRMQAEMHLGLIWLDEERAPEPNLPMARHMIDLMAMLREKTKGNLTIEEERMAENTVTELRFRFVQVRDQAKSQSEKSAEEASNVRSPESNGPTESAAGDQEHETSSPPSSSAASSGDGGQTADETPQSQSPSPRRDQTGSKGAE